jgi:hypothetical protein
VSIRTSIAVAVGALLLAGAAPAAAAAKPAAAKKPAALPKVHYTNNTKVKSAGPDCAVHWNYPGTGVADRTWPAGPGTASPYLGVRYTAGGYALVRDKGRHDSNTAPWWGWIKEKCLVDPHARKFPRVPKPHDLADQPDPDSYAPKLPNRYATGGDNSAKYVDITPGSGSVPPAPGTIHGHVIVGSIGTLRNGPKQFAIGNVGAGWDFQITRSTCRRADGKPYGTEQWVFGYSPGARRWGYVQARHLPACTHP